MISRGLSTPWNNTSSTSIKTFLKHPDVILLVLMAIRLLKQHLSDIVQVDFSMPWMQKMISHGIWHLETSLLWLQQSRFITRTEGRLLLLRAIHLLKTSLTWLRKNYFFGCPVCRKWIGMAWHFEISLHRLHQSRVLRNPDGRLWVLTPIRPPKTSHKRLRKNRFFDAQDSEYDFAWPFDTLKHRFIDFNKVVF
jgi:hypothetical protein